MVSLEAVKKFIKRNKLENSIVCLHASLKSFGPVENGARTIIDGFIESNCTLVCPAFFYDSGIIPKTQNYKRNGIDFQKIEKSSADHAYPGLNYIDSIDQIDKSMGIIPKTLLSLSDTYRTQNPLNSFCVNGKYRDNILKGASLDNAYSAYKNIYNSKITAHIVLAGVDFSACTPIHFAEELSGRNLFRRWAVYHNDVVEVEIGSCSDGFEKIRSHVKEIETEDILGESQIRIYPFNEFIQETASVVKQNPEVTICDNKCERCMDMYSGGRCS